MAAPSLFHELEPRGQNLRDAQPPTVVFICVSVCSFDWFQLSHAFLHHPVLATYVDGSESIRGVAQRISTTPLPGACAWPALSVFLHVYSRHPQRTSKQVREGHVMASWWLCFRHRKGVSASALLCSRLWAVSQASPIRRIRVDKLLGHSVKTTSVGLSCGGELNISNTMPAVCSLSLCRLQKPAFKARRDTE